MDIMEAQTDREIMIHMNGKIDRFGDALERVVDIVERLETIKFDSLEKRIEKLEKFQNMLMGAVAFLASFEVIINLIKLWGNGK